MGLNTFFAAAVTMFRTLSESSAASSGMTMSEGISAISAFFSALWGWVSGIGAAITENWVLLIFVVGIPIAGFLTSWITGLIKRRK